MHKQFTNKITNKSKAIKIIDFNIRKARNMFFSPCCKDMLSVLFSVVYGVFLYISMLIHFISKIKKHRLFSFIHYVINMYSQYIMYLSLSNL